jgi:hypothetical protein
MQQVLLALRGHPSLQELNHIAAVNSEAHGQQLLRSMPWLRVLRLSVIHAEVLGALLEDASGCAQLQELQLGVAGDYAGPAAGSGWARGLAALASGPCRHSLRSIKIRGMPFALWSPTQLAPLLLMGALPQLRELQLDVQVHAASLLPRRSARLQQASRAGAAATQRAPLQQELPVLVGGLQQAGVQGLGGFRLRENWRLIIDGVPSTAFEGWVGPCRFSGRLDVLW